MWSCPAVTRKTLRGSARLLSLSQVDRPVRSLPPNSRTSLVGARAGGAVSPGAAEPASARIRKAGRCQRISGLVLLQGQVVHARVGAAELRRPLGHPERVEGDEQQVALEAVDAHQLVGAP